MAGGREKDTGEVRLLPEDDGTRINRWAWKTTQTRGQKWWWKQCCAYKTTMCHMYNKPTTCPYLHIPSLPWTLSSIIMVRNVKHNLNFEVFFKNPISIFPIWHTAPQQSIMLLIWTSQCSPPGPNMIGPWTLLHLPSITCIAAVMIVSCWQVILTMSSVLMSECDWLMHS